MTAFVLHLVVAALCALGVLSWFGRRSSVGGWRPEGIAFVAVVLFVGTLGFIATELTLAAQSRIAVEATPDSVSARPVLPLSLLAGLQLWLLTLGVYVLSALRGAGRFPAWVADLVVIVAAFLATRASNDVILRITQSGATDAPTIELGKLDTILTVVWIWLVARLCASLGRMPAVAGGYLGLLALTMGLLWLHENGALFPGSATASLAGAGLAAFVVAMRRPTFNLGWSSVLAMGFLLGVASSMSLLENTLPALIALSILALGLPLLNVSVVAVRARLRGYNVEWSNRRLRLDQALARRGVPPRKIALYYFCVGAWLCLLAYLTARWFFAEPPGWLLGTIYALVLAFLAGGGAVIFFSVARLQMRRQPHEDVPDLIEAFGVRISPVSMLEALDRIETFVRSGQPHHVVTSDANAILTSKDDPQYLGIIRNAALITPDGFGVIWGARLLNLPIYERVTGVDMVTGICERAAQNGYTIYILGSEDGVAARAAHNLMERYPGLKVVGTHHGFWRRDGKEAGLSADESDERMAEKIRQAGPDVLFVAMGIPMQEKFIAAQLQRMQVPVAIGVGGSFDVYSGKFTRAPVWVQRVGLEWLYRVWVEPARWKRMSYVPRFMLVALKTWLFGPHPAEQKRSNEQEAF